MGKQWKQSQTLFWGAPKSLQLVTAAMKLKDAYSLEEKLWLTDLDSIFRSRDITLPTKVHLVEAMVFPVVMYRCESWTIKKAECWRTEAFELWCWRRLLRVLWTARRSNQSILKEIIPGCSLEGLMLKLKLQYFGHVKNWLIWKDPDAGKDWGPEEEGTTEDEMAGWHHWYNGRGFGWTPGFGDGQGSLACCGSWGCKELDTTELNWTELNWTEWVIASSVISCAWLFVHFL